jgi:hypothetical protein
LYLFQQDKSIEDIRQVIQQKGGADAKKGLHFFVVGLLAVYFIYTSAFSSELDGWIKSQTCWVVKKPSKKASIVGLIKYKSACTVKDAGGEWYEIVFAPVRDPKTGKFLPNSGSHLFIQKSDFANIIP